MWDKHISNIVLSKTATSVVSTLFHLANNLTPVADILLETTRKFVPLLLLCIDQNTPKLSKWHDTNKSKKREMLNHLDSS